MHWILYYLCLLLSGMKSIRDLGTEILMKCSLQKSHHKGFQKFIHFLSLQKLHYQEYIQESQMRIEIHAFSGSHVVIGKRVQGLY